jgi:hypothetical protein
MFSIESHHLKLIDWNKIGWACVHCNSGKQQSDFYVAKIRRLSHKILSGQVISALAKQIDKALS